MKIYLTLHLDDGTEQALIVHDATPEVVEFVRRQGHIAQTGEGRQFLLGRVSETEDGPRGMRMIEHRTVRNVHIEP